MYSIKLTKTHNPGALMLSILMPAYNEQAVIAPLIVDLLAQADQAALLFPSSKIEIVIAADDSYDYSSLLPTDDRLVYCRPAFKTGPAHARTRALHVATGSHILAIDADDTVNRTFITQVIATLQYLDAFAVTAYYTKNCEIVRSLDLEVLTVDSFIEYSGSVPVVMPRSWMAAYPDVVAEDAVSVINAIHRAGGALTVIDAQYNITTHPQSFCARLGDQFTKLYTDHHRDAAAIAGTVGNPSIAQSVSDLFSARLETNMKFEEALRLGCQLDYHEFAVWKGLKKSPAKPEIARCLA